MGFERLQRMDPSELLSIVKKNEQYFTNIEGMPAGRIVCACFKVIMKVWAHLPHPTCEDEADEDSFVVKDITR